MGYCTDCTRWYRSKRNKALKKAFEEAQNTPNPVRVVREPASFEPDDLSERPKVWEPGYQEYAARRDGIPLAEPTDEELEALKSERTPVWAAEEPVELEE